MGQEDAPAVEPDRPTVGDLVEIVGTNGVTFTTTRSVASGLVSNGAATFANAADEPAPVESEPAPEDEHPAE